MTSQPQTAGGQDTTSEIEISNWKSYTNKTLRGFFTVILPSGMVLNDLQLHESTKGRWINLPCREYKNPNRQPDQAATQYLPYIEFVDDETAWRFRDNVLDALDRFFAKSAQPHAGRTGTNA